MTRMASPTWNGSLRHDRVPRFHHTLKRLVLKKTKTGIVLQARLDSSRLPGKSLLPLGGKPLILRVMEALGKVPAEIRVLACPEDCATAFEPLATEAGFALFTGPKDDVLKRYCLAIRHFGIDHVIRATGDNPFVFADAAVAISAQAIAHAADYAGYLGLPVGGGVEAVSAKALFRAEGEAETPHEREHVCPYLYNHPGLFNLHRVLSPRHWQGADIRLTVDTQEDYRRGQLLYKALDKRENAGGLFNGERYNGEVIIDTYLRVFRQTDGRRSDGGEPA